MPSAVIAYFDYDTATESLIVKYLSGKMYRYLHVPRAVYDQMRGAFAKGVFLNRYIKGKYLFERLTNEQSG